MTRYLEEVRLLVSRDPKDSTEDKILSVRYSRPDMLNQPEEFHQFGMASKDENFYDALPIEFAEDVMVKDLKDLKW